MQKPTFISRLTGCIIACAFGLFILFGTLSSSDFPRLTYQPPPANHDSAESLYAKMGQCGFNQVWNVQGVYVSTTLGDYLDLLDNNGMRAVLRKGDTLDPKHYLVYHYSHAQHQQYEVEYDYYDYPADRDLPDWYHFWHSENDSDEVGVREYIPSDQIWVWKCDTTDHSAGTFLCGPWETIKGIEAEARMSQTGYPDYDMNGQRDSVEFKTIMRVLANTSQLSAATDNVFEVKVQYAGPWAEASTIYTEVFDSTRFVDDEWVDLEINYKVPADDDSSFAIRYKMYWYDNCDFWVDWIEYMDMDRGYRLFYQDAGGYVYREIVIDSIEAECESIINDFGNSLFAWRQSDEPIRSGFEAHGVVNDSLKARLAYQPLTTFMQNSTTLRCSVFAQVTQPEIFVIDPYVFQDPNDFGAQYELDLLAERMEEAYQASLLAGENPVDM